jgi:type IV pilus assembly protein PilM
MARTSACCGVLKLLKKISVMALPFLRNQQKKRDQIVAIDLGSRTTKAVYLQRRGDGFQFLRYSIVDAPIYEKAFEPQILAEHLRTVVASIEPRTKMTKHVTLAVGVNDSILRTAEIPPIPVSEMRLMLKYNSKNYLQQDLPDHVFDCSIIPSRNSGPVEGGKASQKYKVWVGGAKNQLLTDLQTAVRSAGLIPDQVTLGILGPYNAFEVANREVFAREVFALVDIGFKNTTINIVSEGELALSRVVAIGSDKITSGIAEALGVTYAEAEGIKIGMPGEIEGIVQPVLAPLGRELRASIDFFEHQHEKTLTQVFISGGTARSDFIVQTLQSELIVPCQAWNPTGFLGLALPPQQIGEIEQVAPQLAVAVGAATSAF